MKVYIGADHRGFNFKKGIISILEEMHYDVVDVGVHEKGKICDYPKIGYKVAKAVSQDKDSRGILICLSGIGQTIIANKVRGAYAALCYNARTAVLSRKHNNANVLVLSGRFGKKNELRNIIEKWMTTPFEGGRHKRRMQQIKRFEQKECRENQ
ncbi:MAG: RpiB/LacA/LacB family sugar-phosphate isomerase [Candidatus Omnitrophica bacterium]|nr:RpiB/LacA/LacB family sugar-phosphate isomerase [Candidatus Omnitrophota bacterium]